MAQVSHADTATVSAMIRAQDACGFGFRNPLYRAALAGDCRVMEVMPGATARMLKPFLALTGATVAVIGDDGGISSGPQDFPQARRLFGWASKVLVHACGGEPHHYEWVVAAARPGRRVLLVETTTFAQPAWMQVAEDERDRRARKRLPPIDMLLIEVPPHLPAHPLVPEREAA